MFKCLKKSSFETLIISHPLNRNCNLIFEFPFICFMIAILVLKINIL